MPETERPAGDARPNGALRELSADPASRKKFLKTVGGGAAGALALVIAACGDDDKEEGGGGMNQSTQPASAQGDVKILNYALTLEHLEAQFYTDVINANLFSGAQLDTLKKFGATEAEHVEVLSGVVRRMGGTPAAKPRTQFPLESAGAVLQLAATVENLGAAAYLGQAGNIQSKEVLASALAIHSVEARHAATLQALLKKPVTPDGAFAKPAAEADVLRQVKPFIVS